MCLAVPMKVESIEGAVATTTYGGGEYRARIDLVDAKVGDYVLVHAGIAITKLDPEEARETLEIFRQLDEYNRSLPQPQDDGELGPGHPA